MEIRYAVINEYGIIMHDDMNYASAVGACAGLNQGGIVRYSVIQAGYL